jgi:hypothetical protein
VQCCIFWGGADWFGVCMVPCVYACCCSRILSRRWHRPLAWQIALLTVYEAWAVQVVLWARAAGDAWRAASQDVGALGCLCSITVGVTYCPHPLLKYCLLLAMVQ